MAPSKKQQRRQQRKQQMGAVSVETSSPSNITAGDGAGTSLANSTSAAFSLVDGHDFQDSVETTVGKREGATIKRRPIKGGLTQEHLDRIASRNWKSVLSWITFNPDEISYLLDREGQTVLHHACLFRAPSQVVEALLFCSPALARFQNDVGELALHWAARLNLPMEVLKLILQAYPEGGFVQDKDGVSPLELLWDRHCRRLYDLFRTTFTAKQTRTFHTWRRMMLLVNAYATATGKSGGDHGDGDDNNNSSSIDNIEVLPELHAIASCPCPPRFMKFALKLYKEQLSMRDARGRTILHCASSVDDMVVPTEATMEHLTVVVQASPSNAIRSLDNAGKLPLHHALESGKAWDAGGLSLLLKLEPRALSTRDHKSRLYPFQLAASRDSKVDSIYSMLRADPEYIRSAIDATSL
uniref:Uncharacterized protein n=1 Tax=Grammatophora oceanica TaxID=210454 RepID=A0A7S1Y3E1_9STRA|mmetsp:Transcript_15525/g.22816  ORF Transcript_15525/g.22816 Transcript_15525/m.22816 type:complete len:412 (+) Transcript_15525:94-1329(+)